MSKKSKYILEVKLPHLAPLKFVTSILLQSPEKARTEVTFETSPTLSMLVESAAQSTCALSSPMNVKKAFLVSMKNVILLQQPVKKIFEVNVIHIHTFENMNLIDFEVYDSSTIIASGSITLAIEEE